MTSPAGDAISGAPPAPAWVYRTLTAVVAALIIAFYFWTASSAGDPFEFRSKKNDYYNLLADGFLSGHLYLPLQPDPRLLDPDLHVRRQAPFPLDTSFYRGHFYLYFGVTPLLVVFLPWRFVSGHGVPENFAAALLAIAGFLLAVALLDRMRRRFFAATGPGTWLAVVVAVALGSAVPAALRHAIFYEVAICSAFAASMLFFYGSARALEQPLAAGRWLALTGLAYALAVGSRANLVFGGLLLPLLGWAVWRLRPTDRQTGRALARGWLAVGLPAALGLGGLLLYNFLRFRNPLEFGLHYQLGSNPEGFPFRLSFLWHNLRVYYLSLPSFSRYFPFFSPGLEASHPPGYWGIEQVHPQFFAGLFLFPLATALVVLARRRAAPVLWLLGALLGWSWLNGVLLCLTGVRADRYLVDFQPEGLLACALALMALAGRPLPGGRWLRGATVALLLFGSFYDAMASMQLEEFFKTANPRGYARLVHFFDHPAWWAQRVLGDPSGPLRLRVVFPASSPHAAEPLVATGTPWFTDTLYVHYLEPGRISIGFDHGRFGGPASAPIPITPGRPYILVVQMGSLYPPIGDPWLDDLGAAQWQLKRQLRVELDGATVLTTLTNFYDSSPGQVRRGENPLWPSSFTGRFSGRMTDLGRQPVDVAKLATRAKAEIGPLVMQLRFPGGLTGMADPLVAIGRTGRADILFVRYIDRAHIQFGLDHWGVSMIQSAPIPVDYAAGHELEVHLGSLYPPAAEVPALLRDLVMVKLDRQTVFLSRADFYPAGPLAVDVGSNVIGASTCRPYFGGDITEVRRWGAPDVDSDTRGPLAPQIVRLRFPEKIPEAIEPLWAAIDRTGVLLVAQLRAAGPRAVQIGLTRGDSTTWSEPLAFGPGATHALIVGTRFPSPPSAPPPAGWAEYARHRWEKGLRLYVDGRLAVEDAAAEPPAAPGRWAWLIPSLDATAAVSPASVSAADPVIVNSGPIEPALTTTTDWNIQGGWLELELLLPAGSLGEAEPLLTCGRSGRGDALFVTYVDSGHIRLGLDHWGVGAFHSPVIAVDPAGPLSLRIHWDPADGHLTVAAADQVVWDQRVPLFRSADPVFVGSNPLGFSTCSRYFGGEIVRAAFRSAGGAAGR